MGLYINQLSDGTPLPSRRKAEALIYKEPGVVVLGSAPDKFQENLVCVVENGPFDAAGYAYNEREFEEFKAEKRRHTTWLVVPNVKNIAR